MNPLEETQEITVNDVLGFAGKCAAPEVDEEGIEEVLDLEYLSAREIPIALCRVAVEVMKDLTSIASVENEQVSEQILNHDKRKEDK